MIKYYCDCCGQEIKGEYPTQWTLDERDFAESTWTGTVPYRDAMLCEDCYENRLSKLVEVDKRLFDKDYEPADKKRLDECYVVSYCNPFGGEPVVTVFDNKQAAENCMRYFKDQKVGYVGLDVCPLFSEFKTFD